MSVLHQSIEFAKAFHEISTIREGILSALSSYKRALGSDVYELHPNMGILLNVLWLRPLYQKSEQWDTAERFYVLLESEKRNIEILVHTKCLPFLRALKHNLELDMPTVNIFNADNEWKSKTFWKEFCEDTTRKLQWHLGGAVIISGCEALENLADMMSKPPFGDARGGVISGRNVQFGLRHIDLVRLRIEGIGNSMMGLRKVRKWMDLSHTDNPLLLGTGAFGSGKTMFASLMVDRLFQLRKSHDYGIAYAYFDSYSPLSDDNGCQSHAFDAYYDNYDPQASDLVKAPGFPICDDGDKLHVTKHDFSRRTVGTMTSYILYQLLRQLPPGTEVDKFTRGSGLKEFSDWALRRHDPELGRDTQYIRLQLICSHLKSIFKRIYVVIDGIDSIGDTAKIAPFLNAVRTMTDNGIYVLLTAQSSSQSHSTFSALSEIEATFHNPDILKLEYSDEDIALLLDAWMPDVLLPKPLPTDGRFQLYESTIQALVRSAGSNPLILRIWLNSLPKLGNTEDALAGLTGAISFHDFNNKKDAKSAAPFLNRAYDVPCHILSLGTEESLYLSHFFSWVGFSYRPMTIGELSIILNEIGKQKNISFQVPDISLLLRLSKGLVKQTVSPTEDNNDVTLTFSNPSLRTYLQGLPSFGSFMAKERAMFCALYLADSRRHIETYGSEDKSFCICSGIYMCTMGEGGGNYPPIYKTRRTLNDSILIYAAQNIGNHIAELPVNRDPDSLQPMITDDPVTEAVMKLIDDDYASEIYITERQCVTGQASRLDTACEIGHAPAVKRIMAEERIDLKLDKHQLGQNQETPLIWAARNGRFSVVKELLPHYGQHVNLFGGSSPREWTALMWAAAMDYSDTVREISKHPDVDLEAKTDKGMTALMLAAERGHVDVITALLKNGATLKMRTGDGKTPLMLAVISGNPKAVELLLSYPTSVQKALQAFGSTRPPVGISESPDHISGNILHKSLSFNSSSESSALEIEKTPVQPRIQPSKEPFLPSLRKSRVTNFDINATTGDFRQTALSFAIGTNNHIMVNILLAHGASLNPGFPNTVLGHLCGAIMGIAGYRWNNIDSPLTNAILINDLSLVKRLLDAGARINGPKRCVPTPIMKGLEDPNLGASDNYAVLKYLIARGAKVTGISDNEDLTLAGYALTLPLSSGVIHLLRQQGVIFNAKAAIRISEIRNLSCDVWKFLLEDVKIDFQWKCGSKHCRNDCHYDMPLLPYLAVMGRLSDEILDLFVKNGANVDEIGQGKTALWWLVCGCDRSQLGLMQKLLEHGANVNLGDCKPVSQAEEDSYRSMVLPRPAKAVPGSTPLYWANKMRYLQAAEILMNAGGVSFPEDDM